jgi:ABC-type Fe3+/spermidine/putrescine transport system ATPase subunit
MKHEFELVKVIPKDGSESFGIKVESFLGEDSENDIIFDDPKWKYFKYTCSIRPENWKLVHAKKRLYSGIIYTQNSRGKRRAMEVDMKIVNVEK